MEPGGPGRHHTLDRADDTPYLVLHRAHLCSWLRWLFISRPHASAEVPSQFQSRWHELSRVRGMLDHDEDISEQGTVLTLEAIDSGWVQGTVSARVRRAFGGAHIIHYAL